MAPLAKSLALAGSIFAAFASAAPVAKRDNIVVFETSTSVVWTTVDITTTIYADAVPTVVPNVVSAPEVTPTPVAQPQPTESDDDFDDEPEETPAPVPTTTSTTQPAVTPAPVAPTTTVAPQPTQEPAPTTTAVAEPQPTTTTAQAVAPQPTTGSSSGASSSGYTGNCSKGSPCKGQITFYDTATSQSAPSSCGFTNDGSAENVIALPVGLMQDSDCGRTVSIKYGGSVKTGKVVDKCMGCDSTSIDLSRHFFGELADFAAGRLHGVEWWME